MKMELLKIGSLYRIHDNIVGIYIKPLGGPNSFNWNYHAFLVDGETREYLFQSLPILERLS